MELKDDATPAERAIESIRRAQETLGPYKPVGRSAVDDLIADRRADAERE